MAKTPLQEIRKIWRGRSSTFSTFYKWDGLLYVLNQDPNLPICLPEESGWGHEYDEYFNTIRILLEDYPCGKFVLEMPACDLREYPLSFAEIVYFPLPEDYIPSMDMPMNPVIPPHLKMHF